MVFEPDTLATEFQVPLSGTRYMNWVHLLLDPLKRFDTQIGQFQILRVHTSSVFKSSMVHGAHILTTEDQPSQVK